MGNWRKYLLILLVPWFEGCGVKGDPVPPERPPLLGRGRPTYRRATEKVKVQKQQDVIEEDTSDDEDSE